MTEPRKKAPDILKNREELYEQLRLMGADDEIIEIFRLSTFYQALKLMMFIVDHAQGFADGLATIKKTDILKTREELYEQLRLMGADDEIIEIFRLSTFDQVAKLMMFIVVHAQAFADDLANIKKSR